MLRLIDPDRTAEYIHPSDTEEPRTVFHVLPLTEGRAMELRTEFPDFGADESQAQEFVRALFLKCISSIENIRWPDGTDFVTVTDEQLRERLFGFLSPAVKRDLVSHIMGVEQEKNSGGPSE